MQELREERVARQEQRRDHRLGGDRAPASTQTAPLGSVGVSPGEVRGIPNSGLWQS